MDIIPIDNKETLEKVLADIEKRLRAGLEIVTSIDGVEAARFQALGNQGDLTVLRRGLGSAPRETRVELAPIIAAKQAEFERLVADRLAQVL